MGGVDHSIVRKSLFFSHYDRVSVANSFYSILKSGRRALFT